MRMLDLMLSGTLMLGTMAPGLGFAEEAGGSAATPAAASAELSEQEVFQARLNDYWDSKLKNIAKVYTFYQPHSEGGPKFTNEVSEGGSIFPESFEITKVKVNGEKADVEVEVVMDTESVGVKLALEDRTMTFKGQWFKSKTGVWYKVPVKPKGLPTTQPRRKPAPDPARVEEGAKAE